MKKIIFLSFVFLSTFSVAADTDKQKFWTDFRKAFLAKDFTTLKQLTVFPLEVRGEADSDPNLKVKEENFEKCLLVIYDRDVGLGGKLESHEAFVKRSSRLSLIKDNGKPISKAPADEKFRVASMEFSGAPFKLERLFYDTSDSGTRKTCVP